MSDTDLIVENDLLNSFFASDAIAYDTKSATTQISDGVFTLQCRALWDSPVDISVLCHEMAHVIEIENDRVWWEASFGLNLREIEFLGKIYREPLTDQSTCREVRVLGIQWRLQEMFGHTQVNYRVFETASSFRWLPDTVAYYCNRPSLKKVPYRKQKFAITKRIIRDALKVYHEWPEWRILGEWKQKIQQLDSAKNRQYRIGA